MPLRAQEVFVPGAFPKHTYVERKSEGLEGSLRDAILTPGIVVALSGPSKCGKTVLIERVVGVDALIPISGAGLLKPDDIWNRALDWMGYASTETTNSTTTVGGSVGAEAGGGLSAFGLAKASGKVSGQVQGSSANSTSATIQRRGITQVVEAIGNSEYVLLIDDFHYMPRDVQIEAAKALKEAARLGVKVITAQVNYRGDDVVRALPELRGRVRAVDMKYWTPEELEQIAVTGFAALGLGISGPTIANFVAEAAGSPQLMQSICLQTCFDLGHREKTDAIVNRDIVPGAQQVIFESTCSTADFRSLVDVLDAGPRTRGTERKTYKFTDGTEGDVYRCVMKAVALNPPRLSFTYDNLLERTASVCDGANPVGSSVAGTCTHMAKLALEKFPQDRVIDWDETKGILDLPNPYFLFYLRWSNRLEEGA